MKAKIDYSSLKTPRNYKCTDCGATGVKLWRGWQDITFDPLLCADCAGKHENIDISEMNEQGTIPHPDGPSHRRTDQLGWFVPAVPTAHVSGYWGYTSAPDEACAWWHRLPLRIEKLNKRRKHGCTG